MRGVRRPSPAMIVALVALFVALGGTAMAAIVVSDNSQVAPGTISGHEPPAGKHSNLIAGSVDGTDLADESVTRAKLKTPATFTNAGLPDVEGDPYTCDSPADWRNLRPSENARVGYYRDPSGFVYLQGRAIPGDCVDEDPPVFTLPPGHAPAKRRFLPAASGEVTVEPSGEVKTVGSSEASLDGIVFRCGPRGQNGCP
jgi:hypothetical protein